MIRLMKEKGLYFVLSFFPPQLCISLPAPISFYFLLYLQFFLTLLSPWNLMHEVNTVHKCMLLFITDFIFLKKGKHFINSLLLKKLWELSLIFVSCDSEILDRNFFFLNLVILCYRLHALSMRGWIQFLCKMWFSFWSTPFLF